MAISKSLSQGEIEELIYHTDYKCDAWPSNRDISVFTQVLYLPPKSLRLGS